MCCRSACSGDAAEVTAALCLHGSRVSGAGDGQPWSASAALEAERVEQGIRGSMPGAVHGSETVPKANEGWDREGE